MSMFRILKKSASLPKKIPTLQMESVEPQKKLAALHMESENVMSPYDSSIYLIPEDINFRLSSNQVEQMKSLLLEKYSISFEDNRISFEDNDTIQFSTGLL